MLLLIYVSSSLYLDQSDDSSRLVEIRIRQLVEKEVLKKRYSTKNIINIKEGAVVLPKQSTVVKLCYNRKNELIRSGLRKSQAACSQA